MSHPPRIYALIVAAGTGSRAGEGTPKQYRPIAGKPMLRYSCEAFLSHPNIAGVQVVIHPDHEDHYEAAVNSLPHRGRAGVGPLGHAESDNGPLPTSPLRVEELLPPIHGGATRSDSVRAGLAALAAHNPDYVLIHDAARPFLSAHTLDRLIAALSPEVGVVPALAVVDTVRRQEGASWAEIPRDGLMRIQTPQAFPFRTLHTLMAGHPSPHRGEDGRGASLAPTSQQIMPPPQPSPYGGGSPTDDAAIWLAAGLALVYVEGEERLRKVTTAADIAWAEKNANATRRVAVGMGTDVHQLMPAGDKHIIRLGGIDISHDHKLHGHSDADVVLHAVVDALLGALAEGDIGTHFPPSDERWKGADSKIFMQEAQRRVVARGGEIQHLDITILCESPKISPHRDAMREAVATMLNLPRARVSIKATTTEKLGFTGRGEGIAAQAVATLTLPEDA